MGNPNQCVAFNRTRELRDKKVPHFVYKSDLVDHVIRPGEEDTEFIVDICSLTPTGPERCLRLVRGNNSCGSVNGKIKCVNLERSQ